MLYHELNTLNDWESFGKYLQGITLNDIEQIKSKYEDLPSRKLALYDKWVLKCSDLSWKDVADALKKAGELELVRLFL